MFIVFDIGGTHMRVGCSIDGGEIDRSKSIDTPQDFSAAIEAFGLIADELSEGAEIKAAAGGIAGPLNADRSLLLNAPNLPDWIGQPLKQSLTDRLKTQVLLENDSALVGLGEAHAGAGQNAKIMAYLTVSTGLGGARIVDGKIDRATIGFEPGHQRIGSEWVTGEAHGLPLDLEDFVSGAAIKRHLHVEAETVASKPLWNEVLRGVALAIHNTIVFWSPELIVVGGALSHNPHFDFDALRGYVKELLTIFPEAPEIRQAALDEYGGLQGALVHLQQHL